MCTPCDRVKIEVLGTPARPHQDRYDGRCEKWAMKHVVGVSNIWLNLCEIEKILENNMKSYNYDDTRANCRSNEYKQWSNNLDTGKSAKDRYENDFFYVKTKPKNRFSRDAKVFTIGSCFARNIERELRANKIMTLTDGIQIPADFYEVSADPRAAMNKFNIPSILDELCRAFDPDANLINGLIPAGSDLWFDPATTSIRMMTIDEAIQLRTTVVETMQKIAEADVIIFTLGLVEMWRDRLTGLNLNTHPHPKAVRFETGLRQELARNLHQAQKNIEAARIGGKAPNNDDLALVEATTEDKLQSRFEFLRPEYADLVVDMHKIVALCTKVAPQAKVVITVSPVPLQTTMTPDDVVCSSTYSKAILRVIAEEMRQSYDHVDYFPSFEMVTNSPRSLAWLDDQVHAHPDTVSKVTSTFVNEWFETA